MNPRAKFIDQIEIHVRFLKGIGAEIQSWQIWPVATDEQVQEAEDQLGFELPPSLRNLFQTVAASVDFDWVHLADHTEDHELYGAKGAVNWSLPRLSADYAIAKKWATDDGSEWARIWQSTLPVVDVGCGDYIGIALSNGTDVVYLNHEAQDAHGKIISPDFETFVHEWSALMFPGPDWAYWRPFLDDDSHFLSSTSQVAIDWPKWLAGELE